ncbi:hypothetical protein HFP57_13600 [Parasphingopyxis algicola]|uniref:ATP-binding protein n=1 Tax=Parasphingopyxis algicola TaxID=2026624 RepID=UPI0015A0B5B2|nr:ATP-binding protein [Parasphingopyxis algicola]QLC25956.1 hypothetical protein HFP57_13600 [Parasphingopyxis algicola]
MSNDQFSLDLQPPERTLPQLWTADDIYNACDQSVIEGFGEDHRVERKRVEVHARDLAVYVSMWSNTQPHGGVVFIGVANSGEIRGCANAATTHLNDLRSVRTYCPDAKVEFKEIPVTNDKGADDFVLAVRVHYRHDKLVECASGEAYVREGESKRRLSEAEKREIRLNKGELDFESDGVALRYPDDFNADLLALFHSEFVRKRSLSRRDYSIEDVLYLTKMGKSGPNGFEPNIACALMFAKDPRRVLPGAFIRVRRYDGIEEQFGTSMNVLADETFDGALPNQIADAETFIAQQIRNFTRLGADGRFVTSPEYPREVWLEALVNAAVHRSYNLKNMNIFVKMFEDKLVVESPGGFMPPTTAESVYDAHNPRNPNLMWGMYYLDFVQCAFEGTRRMRRGMREANLPDPIFSSKEIGIFQVSVVLENAIEHRKSFIRAEAAPGIDQKIYENLCQEEKMIVNALADGKDLNVNDAMLLVGKDWRATRAFFDHLMDMGIVGQTPGKARNRWRKYYLVLGTKSPASRG